MRTIEKLTDDLFYVDLDKEKVEWIYFKFDSVSGGLFVHYLIDRDQFMKAFESAKNKAMTFALLRESCEPLISERGTEDFLDDCRYLLNVDPFISGCNEETANTLANLYLAKDYINAYCSREFKSEGDFSDLAAIPIGYTTVTDNEYSLQAYANLEDLRIEVYLNDKLAKFYQFDSLSDMVNIELPSLEFENLIDIPEGMIDIFDREYRIEDLAIRMSFFVKECDPNLYEELLVSGETDTDMFRLIKKHLHDLEWIPGGMEHLQKLAISGELSEAEAERCYIIMTDLYHLYAKERLEPVDNRVTEILTETLYELNLKVCRMSFDRYGLHLVHGTHKLRGVDIYKYLEATLSVEALHVFRANNFETFTDFMDLAAENGVTFSGEIRLKPDRHISL